MKYGRSKSGQGILRLSEAEQDIVVNTDCYCFIINRYCCGAFAIRRHGPVFIFLTGLYAFQTLKMRYGIDVPTGQAADNDICNHVLILNGGCPARNYRFSHVRKWWYEEK